MIKVFKPHNCSEAEFKLLLKSGSLFIDFALKMSISMPCKLTGSIYICVCFHQTSSKPQEVVIPQVVVKSQPPAMVYLSQVCKFHKKDHLKEQMLKFGKVLTVRIENHRALWYVLPLAFILHVIMTYARRLCLWVGLYF